MSGSGREARRRRILQGGQDRLALITGRKPNSADSKDLDQSPPFVPNLNQDLKSDQPSASYNEEDKSFSFMSSINDQAAKTNQDDVLRGQSNDETFVHKPDPSTEPSRAPISDIVNNRGESASSVPSAVLTASDFALRLAQQIPIGKLTSQQVSSAVGDTEQDRMLCAITMGILVVLSYSGFPIVSWRIFQWIILFRPLFLVLIANIALICRRLRPENQRHLARVEKGDNDPLLGEGYAWAEEAGRALELGLMLQSVVSALFMDCSVYATIVVFGLSLFG